LSSKKEWIRFEMELLICVVKSLPTLIKAKVFIVSEETEVLTVRFHVGPMQLQMNIWVVACCFSEAAADPEFRSWLQQDSACFFGPGLGTGVKNV